LDTQPMKIIAMSVEDTTQLVIWWARSRKMFLNLFENDLIILKQILTNFKIIWV